MAAGLILGGKKPVVVIQCTGLFEAGDALRNAVHDMKLPLFLIVGVPADYLHQQGKTADRMSFQVGTRRVPLLPIARLCGEAKATSLSGS